MIVWVSQKGEHSSHHPGANCLTWMHSRRYYNSLSGGEVVQIVPRSYGEDVAGLSRQSFAQLLLRHEKLSIRVRLYANQVISQIRVRIGNRVGKVHGVSIILEAILECQRVITLAVVCHIFFYSILEVANIITSLMPSHVLLIILFLAVD